MFRDKMNMYFEMNECTGNTWNHRKGNENLKKNLEAVPWKRSMDSLQKTRGTSHVIRKVLQYEN